MNSRIIDVVFQMKAACSEKEEKIRNMLELDPAEFRGLLTIIPGSSLPCHIISKKMGLSKSRCSRVIEKMIKNGYLKESGNDDDRRIMNVTLTPKGIKTRTKIYNMLQDCENLILNRLTKTELRDVENSMIKILEILNTD